MVPTRTVTTSGTMNSIQSCRNMAPATLKQIRGHLARVLSHFSGSPKSWIHFKWDWLDLPDTLQGLVMTWS